MTGRKVDDPVLDAALGDLRRLIIQASPKRYYPDKEMVALQDYRDRHAQSLRAAPG